MITPISIEEHNILYREKDPEYSVDFLIDKINEIVEHINGEEVDSFYGKPHPAVDEWKKTWAELNKNLENADEQIEKNRRSPDPDCTSCNGTGVIEDTEQEKSFPCYCVKRLPPIVMEKSEKLDLTEEYKRRGLKPINEVSNCCGAKVKVVPENAGRGETQFYQCQECKKPCDLTAGTLDRTDAAYDPIDTRAYNIKLWTRDMRKMIKGKNISPKLKDDIRRKLNELEEI